MSNIVFRKQASKGAFSQAHVKAFNEAPYLEKAGDQALRNMEVASAWAKDVANSKIFA